LQAISAFGKRQVIAYGGPNNNQAAGGGLACYKRLRRYHDSGDNANFAAELQATIVSSTQNKRWLADQCYRKNLALWSGASTTSPMRNIPQPPRPPGALPRTPVDLAEALIDTWLAATALPTRDEMDIVCLVLEPWLANGNGANTLVNYDPHKVVASGLSRPPQVALFHELVHAYYNAMGGQLGREDSLNEGNGGRLFELMSVGLPPFDTRPYGENQFRNVLGVALRTQYP
jgi:Effector protein